MRLLHVQTHTFTDFQGDDIPTYAILSHVWQQRQEVTYQEWLQPTNEVRSKSGYRKICEACQKARDDAYEWIWVDTNCIDKTSSAELSEAVNSMHAWYRNAAVCYAFLEDVSPVSATASDPFAGFRASRWHTRGWTLQELLAPRKVIFFAKDWSNMGTRDWLFKEIEAVTGINVEDCRREVKTASVARKMSWLARRKTTRIEDMAYCMLGLFNINMPLLYGEGGKAFIRLQEEIIKNTPDLTIFCWTRDDSTPSDWYGLLAPSPQVFAQAGDFCVDPIRENIHKSPWTMTNRGLAMRLPVIHTFEGALLWLFGTRLGGEPGEMFHLIRSPPVVAIPISGRFETSRGHFRLPVPRGPIIIPGLGEYNSDYKTVVPWCYICLADLSLVPTGETAVPRIFKTLNAWPESARADLLLLMGYNVANFVPQHLSIDSQLRKPRQSKGTLSRSISAPEAVFFEPASGAVRLVQVQKDDTYLLAGAIELFSASDWKMPRPNIHIRIFLAFEKGADNPVAPSWHFCTMSTRTTPYSSANLEATRVEHNAAIFALREWYNMQLDKVLSGRAL
ncbi:HET domain-containing protein [Microdochium nivale]|nr:HET domain-containing protein [Microdochium nivale]